MLWGQYAPPPSYFEKLQIHVQFSEAERSCVLFTSFLPCITGMQCAKQEIGSDMINAPYFDFASFT